MLNLILVNSASDNSRQSAPATVWEAVSAFFAVHAEATQLISKKAWDRFPKSSLVPVGGIIQPALRIWNCFPVIGICGACARRASDKSPETDISAALLTGLYRTQWRALCDQSCRHWNFVGHNFKSPLSLQSMANQDLPACHASLGVQSSQRGHLQPESCYL